MTIKSFKKEMIAKAIKKEKIWENFGQKELSKLRDKYINSSSYTDEMNKKRKELNELDNWASHFDLSQLV